MDIICDTKINEHMYERVLCSQVILIIKWMPRNSKYQ